MSTQNVLYVIKIGTNVLTDDKGKLDRSRLQTIASQIASLRSSVKFNVIIVSSAAITCGAQHLNIQPQTVAEKQAASCVGQVLLMDEYGTAFSAYNVSVGQLLLTKDGLHNEERKTNTLNALSTLLNKGIIPIINENDAVATDEINFGDNDQLSAEVAILVNAAGLILLSDVDGVHDSNPKLNPNSKRMSTIAPLTQGHFDMVADEENGRSKGGMESKLLAAKLANAANIPVHIANGKQDNVLSNIFNGNDVGTIIQP